MSIRSLCSILNLISSLILRISNLCSYLFKSFSNQFSIHFLPNNLKMQKPLAAPAINDITMFIEITIVFIIFIFFIAPSLPKAKTVIRLILSSLVSL